MRRSTAAVIGTLAGAAMLVGVRLTATPVVLGGQPVATEPIADQQPAGNGGGQGGDGTFRGQAIQYPYGTIQVSVRVAGGRITAADATYPTDGNSATVNGNAIPKLREATLQAQNAQLDTVSGATYTSDGYRRSLQSALDQAGLRGN
ncbi:FMN-binding protein [Pilimelia anulata]|uniref:FMN-binding protein n=1 Tax=Pilimelia anulata TaxID=53371 RepID=A0A8J3F7L6_9ACTN|nr:FMN-binding protein [Pilimelia anulata]GGJ77916.1 FMN-binding protein [Pilimelia anulata]